MKRFVLGMFVSAITGAACDLPRDPEGTLRRVRGGELRAGVLHAAPWAHMDSGRPSGIEVLAVEALASELGARVRWSSGSETKLMAELERFEIDLVVGGLLASSPYAKQVGFTRPYYVERRAGEKLEHVLAVPPGENAWLVRVEAFLERQRSELARRAREEDGA